MARVLASLGSGVGYVYECYTLYNIALRGGSVRGNAAPRSPLACWRAGVLAWGSRARRRARVLLTSGPEGTKKAPGREPRGIVIRSLAMLAHQGDHLKTRIFKPVNIGDVD